jgi:hypothetical protein
VFQLSAKDSMISYSIFLVNRRKFKQYVPDIASWGRKRVARSKSGKWE